MKQVNDAGMTMCSHASKRLAACCLALLVCATSSLGQGGVTLIGPSTRNGSFEAEAAFPWRDVQAVNAPPIASDGGWYGICQDTPNGQTARAVPNQYFPADFNPYVNPDNGFEFIFTFDARNGSAGFDTVSGYINAWNGDGSPVVTETALIISPPLSDTGWSHYKTTFQLPETWDGRGGFIAGIHFSKIGALIGAAYTGYIDNVVLTQIPEPSLCALLGLGGLCLGLVAFQRRAAGSGRIELNRRQG